MGDAEPGGVLAARYRLRAVLRRDETGAVWLARDGLRHRDVAVTAVPLARSPGDDERESPHQRALGEARALARLDHPNIPVIFDVVEDDGVTWMVLQAAPYQSPYRSLSDVVRGDGPLPPQRAAEAGFQILSALRAAHAVGVPHGDVRPGNVLLGPGNWAMIAGFGMVSARGGQAAPDPPAGSPCYLAPERAGGHAVTLAADLWSLGATLYAAVEGRPPFHGDNPAAVRTAVIRGHPDLPGRAGPLWPVISGLLRKDPAARPDAAGVDWLLRRVAGARDAGGPVPPAEPAGPPARAVPEPASPPARAVPEPAGPPARAAPAPGGPPRASQGGVVAVRPATVPPARTTGGGQDASAADFIPGFGPREPAPAGEDPECEDPPSGEPLESSGRRRRRLLAPPLDRITE